MNFFFILGRDESGEYELLGDITIASDTNVIVNNDYDGVGNRYFDNISDALRYIKGRICMEPVYYDPVRRQEVRIQLVRLSAR